MTENGVMVCNSAKPHPRRAEFYQLAEHYPIDKALNKIDPITLKDKIIEKSKRFLFKTGLITVARHLNKGKKLRLLRISNWIASIYSHTYLKMESVRFFNRMILWEDTNATY